MKPFGEDVHMHWEGPRPSCCQWSCARACSSSRDLAPVVLVSLLGLAGKFMIDTWRQSTAIMSIHGYIALCLGVFFSLLIGCGLMGMLFYSSRRGYDEQAEFIVPSDDK